MQEEFFEHFERDSLSDGIFFGAGIDKEKLDLDFYKQIPDILRAIELTHFSSNKVKAVIDHYKKKILCLSVLSASGSHKNIHQECLRRVVNAHKYISYPGYRELLSLREQSFRAFLSHPRKNRMMLEIMIPMDIIINKVKVRLSLTSKPMKLTKEGSLWIEMCQTEFLPWLATGQYYIFDSSEKKVFVYEKEYVMQIHTMQLTDIQKSILYKTLEGMKISEKASILNISEKTVKKNHKKILDMMQVTDINVAATLARRLGLF